LVAVFERIRKVANKIIENPIAPRIYENIEESEKTYTMWLI
jgi:hypothetical protein